VQKSARDVEAKAGAHGDELMKKQVHAASGEFLRRAAILTQSKEASNHEG
jgi:hypothetical protein